MSRLTRLLAVLAVVFLPAAAPGLAHAATPGAVSTAIEQAGALVAADTGEAPISVAVSGDAIFLGAPNATIGSRPGGAVFVFTEPAGGWSGTLHEAGVLTGSDATSQLGSDVLASGATVLARAGDNLDVFTEPAGG